MKSYTDIEQSKKLAEILPLESADMCLTFVNNVWNPVWGKANDIYQLQKYCYEPNYTKDEYVDIDEFEPKVVSCWSLSALIELMPASIIYGYSEDDLYLLKIYKDDYKYFVEYRKEIKSKISNCYKTKFEESSENLIDALFNVICHLLENKLI